MSPGLFGGLQVLRRRGRHEAERVAAGSLCLVEDSVRSSENRFDSVLGREIGKPHATARTYTFRRIRDSDCRHVVHETADKGLTVLETRIRKDYRELVPSITGNEVVFSRKGAGKRITDGSQHQVSGCMTVVVVDFLEPVEIDHDEREWLAQDESHVEALR